MANNSKKLIIYTYSLIISACTAENTEKPEKPINIYEAHAEVEARKAKTRCLDNADETEAEAKSSLKKGRPADAEYLLLPCMSFAPTPEKLRKLYAVAHAKVEAQDKKRRKSQGVSIGMTTEEVLASSWGKPRDINRTIRASGTREQWVYGNGNYLYFQNGILTAIQN